ncbi:Uncharacterised protein [Moraxella bovis]|uniref:Uncharacterized protein n=1 Tax=Moraxella bovis TaxID=476 RepID=A0A378PYP4_MORBO|nr:Uncharacterised protein [Moraxella bovis]STY93661.1 Uncharacterised protein [Moraxella bovis]STY93677.1 Uncharacterised protein [Moraxella bovis]STY93826.1 Uncharacterised protein [Moraxella bovis]STY93931.1 Uncharacterised protein [Moraxella bovis]
MAYSLKIRQKALAYDDKCKNIDLVIEAFGVQDTPCFVGDDNLKKQAICLVKNPPTDPESLTEKSFLLT